MSFVIDSSMTLAWIYEDEKSEPIERVLDLVHRHGAWVPTIWRLEVANALQQGIRRKRINRAARDEALAELSRMNISTDGQTNDFAWRDTLSMADSFSLTPYDASYLELASRRKLSLATLDRELQ